MTEKMRMTTIWISPDTYQKLLYVERSFDNEKWAQHKSERCCKRTARILEETSVLKLYV